MIVMGTKMIRFTKMEGLGNDYVYINCLKENERKIDYISKLASKISNRHFGIGSDGLIIICDSKVADFKMKMYNSDGSESQMCGNGIRCVGKYVYEKGLTNKEDITIETLGGIKAIHVNIINNKVKTVTVNMGKPILNEKLIPCISNANMYSNFIKDKIYHVKLHIMERPLNFTCVSMGNPHAVTIVEDLNDIDIKKYGKLIECDEHFPEKTNVEFIQKIDDYTIKMRVWERGTGETLACGTGASAAVVACILNNIIEKDKEITVKLLGGDLAIKWKDYVYMTGAANIIFEGEYYDNNK